MSKKKERLDTLLSEQYPDLSDKECQGYIQGGKVIVNNEKITKVGTLVPKTAEIRILLPKSAYVSRGGDKLAGAAKAFELDFSDAVVLDVGISTGGFTDFVRKNGARRMIGIDVGYGQVALPVFEDPRVIVLERTNARTLTKEALQEAILKEDPSGPDLSEITHVVMDVSFISVTQILPVVKTWLPQSVTYSILIKPQFEASKSEIPPGGIIKDPQLRETIKSRVHASLEDAGFVIVSECDSPIQGTKGNQEYFFQLA